MLLPASRRNFIKGIAATSIVLGMSSVPSLATEAKPVGPFTLPKLGYSYSALEPVIDAKTMELHLTKHHQAYIDKLNAEVAKTSGLKGRTIEQIIGNVSNYSPAVRNNAGGHWNHSFFWKLMGPAKDSGEPSPELKAAIEKKFTSIDNFKVEFEKAGAGQFGSGWVWLIKNASGDLEITSTPNQDNPLMDDAKVKGTPLLGNDVWEHAYYLKYQNKRPDYLKNWWKIVNWKQVSENFAKAE
ncbi:MAG: superoxide dismutase [Micavibrio aeruginosavorus]|uniref:Superoxide dismutase n=1 Tax=Micavibrio aeruginosavorus TaxID=349221 RepID=A0A2W5FN54_9BACT|nr:MAG: superoxide dismutase [Micavibrio aeruginosavorus]